MSINNVYFPTWVNNLNWDKGEGRSTLALIPKYINYVTLSFLRPDTDYSSIDSPMNRLFYDGDIPLEILKREISYCRKNSKERTILASTGGEIAGNFLKVNYTNLVNAIVDLDLDGIDIDYEPNGVMTESLDEINKYVELISGFREALDKKSKITGKKYIISCAPTGIGLLAKENDFTKLGVTDCSLTRFNSREFNNISTNFKVTIDNLKSIVPKDQHDEELLIGSLSDDNILKQTNYRVGSVGSCYGFNSAGKMASVFLANSNNSQLSDYEYIGQMVDIVFYQAYNMGSGNLLGKILCYESHRSLSNFFNSKKDGSGFKIGHGSHVGMEAWPHFSYTKKRLQYIYSYIKKYGRDCDGASFWSYLSPHIDESDNVPPYGMEYNSTTEIFRHVSSLLGIDS